MSTLYNDIFYTIRGKCISDESASRAAEEVVKLVAGKLTESNTQTTPCAKCELSLKMYLPYCGWCGWHLNVRHPDTA